MLPVPFAPVNLPRRARSRRERGVTLVEVLITVFIIVLVTGLAAFGFGALSGSRLKTSAVQVGGSVRIAYAHATAISRPVRLVFDFDERKILIEEGSGKHLVSKGKSGGAESAGDAAAEAEEAGRSVAGGSHTPKASFEQAKEMVGFPAEGIELPTGIQFWQVETAHQEEPITGGKAYLYFFPGGQTENASIQLRVTNADEKDDTQYMSVTVSPLTGRTAVTKGRARMSVVRDDDEPRDREEVQP
jgi:general secretion pathway protein H